MQQMVDTLEQFVNSTYRSCSKNAPRA